MDGTLSRCSRVPVQFWTAFLSPCLERRSVMRFRSAGPDGGSRNDSDDSCIGYNLAAITGSHLSTQATRAGTQSSRVSASITQKCCLCTRRDKQQSQGRKSLPLVVRGSQRLNAETAQDVRRSHCSNSRCSESSLVEVAEA